MSEGVSVFSKNQGRIETVAGEVFLQHKLFSAHINAQSTCENRRGGWLKECDVTGSLTMSHSTLKVVFLNFQLKYTHRTASLIVP